VEHAVERDLAAVEPVALRLGETAERIARFRGF